MDPDRLREPDGPMRSLSFPMDDPDRIQPLQEVREVRAGRGDGDPELLGRRRPLEVELKEDGPGHLLTEEGEEDLLLLRDGGAEARGGLREAALVAALEPDRDQPLAAEL